MPSHSLSRRHLLQSVTALAAMSAVPFAAQAAPVKPKPVNGTDLQWLDGAAPAQFDGATFGVPWPRGTLKANTNFQLGNVAVQSWPLAYWPDGSLKWSAHAVPAGIRGDQFALGAGKPAAPAEAVSVTETPALITITSGDLVWRIPTSGEHLIASASRSGRETLKDMKLVALTQDQPDLEATGTIKQSRYVSAVQKVIVEQTGPVRAVVKIDGVHTDGTRQWLPFSVRLYFYAGSEQVRIVHSFIFDGDTTKDYIRGLGVTAKTPMTDATYDRHIRIAGEDVGVWGEAVRPLTGLRQNPGDAFKAAQIDGKAIPDLSGMNPILRDGLKWIPEWGDFTLSQLTPDGFEIKKRTRENHAWVMSNRGTRTKGLIYVGGASGGVALGVKDFWQRSPTQLDVRNAETELAEVTAWLYSPDAPAMDMRPYRSVDGSDTHAKQIEAMGITYEDYEPGWDSAYGVARTSELNLWVLKGTPTHDRFSAFAESVANPQRLVLTPERIHEAGVFGDWDVANSSTPARKILEDRLTHQIDHYINEVEQRRWYGFWDYGDVMHTYDADRHMWRYDIGGYAWDNSELSPDLWIWYTYLRTGRADVFKFAEAMTRHTGEVDVYHLGPWKGFGTRHGVQHWSDSSKQPRVSTAAYRRIYYYLTGDERVGDLMRDIVNSEYTLESVNISRKLASAPQHEIVGGMVSAGFGTSWSSFLAAWLTEWERTGDKQWRQRIVNGMESIGAMKKRWFAGGAPFDLKTGKFQGDGDYVGISHLNAVFGAVEIHSELFQLVDVPSYRKAWLEYCRYYNAPEAEVAALLGQPTRGRNLRDAHSRLTAYAAYHEKDRALALRAWSEFFGLELRETHPGLNRQTTRIDGTKVLRPIDEDATLYTNGAAQWGLAAIQNMALIGDTLEEAAKKEGIIG
ncbi:Tat pathway signal sequence domain protein [Asticcacaulis tiandongensis]|uniref:exo-rhamnogalacturonan lyase family protein n=1 Tax=Asticcacaulis tiandongensis TaxID=2565365 RepID=UPI0011285D53|nr:Tat pathway signal sequence domain protein [Asticcacaulis tiandongensis]